MTITVYEYILYMQPVVLVQLYEIGLLDGLISGKKEVEITRTEIISLMRHDSYKRVRGTLRQIHPGRVIV